MIGDQSEGVAVSPGDGRVAVGNPDHAIALWDPTDRLPVQYIRGHTALISDVTFSPDGGRIASASHDGTVRLWDVGNGREIAVLRGHTAAVLSVGFSPDGQRIVSSGADGTVKVWDVGASSDVLPVKTIGWGFRVAYSPDGHRTVFTFYGQVLIVEGATGKVHCEIAMPTDSGGVTGLAFFPDGRRLVTCSEWPCPAIVWDAETGQRLFDLTRIRATSFGRPQSARTAGPLPRRATTALSGSGTPRPAGPAWFSAAMTGVHAPSLSTARGVSSPRSAGTASSASGIRQTVLRWENSAGPSSSGSNLCSTAHLRSTRVGNVSPRRATTARSLSGTSTRPMLP